MGTKKVDLDARRILELLREDAPPAALAERLGASAHAVDEARCLADEIATAEVDAILALPSALARALLHAACAAGRHELLAEAAASADKDVQREAKRLAHNLKLRGVEVALPAKPEPAPAPAPPPPAAAEPPVFVSSVDARGERAVFWTRALPGRGIEVAQLVLSDVRGVVACSIGELGKKRFRELCEELPRTGSLTIVEVPREAARALVDAARVVGRASGELPAGFATWAPQVLGPTPAEAPPPPSPEGPGKAGTAELDELARRSATLLAEPELARWSPDEDTLRRTLLRLEEAAASPLYLQGAAGDAQRAEAVGAALDRAAQAWLESEGGARVAARLRDMAWLFERCGRPEPARLADAAATKLAAGASAADVPLVKELFARIFAPAGPPPAPAEPAPGSPLILPR